jgi:hypothetical protein
MRTNPLEAATLQGDELIHTPIGDIELRHTYLDDDASRRLFDEMDFQRACQAYIWSQPIVSLTTWRLRQGEAHGVKGPNDFVVLDSLKEKRGIVTANLSTPYILQFTSLKDGPLVVEYPGGMTAGGFVDLWQRPVADTGLTGPDGGKGGTYVVVGLEIPGFSGHPGSGTCERPRSAQGLRRPGGCGGASDCRTFRCSQ